MDRSKKVSLISSNGMGFHDLDLAVLSGCRLIMERIENVMHQNEEGCCDDDDEIITLRVPEITGKILALVLEYCRNSTSHEEDLMRWEAKLAIEVDEAVLAHLILAADYLDMWELVSLAGDVMSRKCKTPLEISEIFTRRLETEEEEVSRQTLANF